MSVPNTTRGRRGLRWFRRLSLILGLACVGLAAVGFFAIVTIRTPVAADGSRVAVELLFGELAFSRYALEAIPDEHLEGWEFEREPNRFPIQLKSQKLGESLRPWSASPPGLIHSFEYRPRSTMHGSGYCV